MEKLGSLFDRSFLVAFWAPAFVGLALAIGLAAVAIDPQEVGDWWRERDATEQAVLAGGALVGVTLVAYMLQALAIPLLRVYEGYWTDFRILTNWAIASEERRFTRLDDALAKLEAKLKAKEHLSDAERLKREEIVDALHFQFPIDRRRIRATRIGNILSAADDYPFQRYSIDGPLWWPRLTAVLPDNLRSQIDAALTPVQALLNLTTVLTLIAIIEAGTLWWFDGRWSFFCGVFLGGLFVAYLCYKGAISQAKVYGDFVRVAFDLHRHAILKQMRIPLPRDYAEERLLWTALNESFFEFIVPWDAREAARVSVIDTAAKTMYYERPSAGGEK